MHKNTDFYEILGVTQDATQERIKTAWRKLVIKHHPDQGGTAEMFMAINYAYKQLSDIDTRRNYDRSRAYHNRASSSDSGHAHEKAKEESSKKRAAPEEPEDYTKAVFVDGIESRDKSGATHYVRRGDFVYYPAPFRNKFLFWSYGDTEYYRARVKKVYSRKQNDFHTVPLFVVEVEGFEQLIFVSDFSRHWFADRTYARREMNKAFRTATLWIVGIFIVLYFIS